MLIKNEAMRQSGPRHKDLLRVIVCSSGFQAFCWSGTQLKLSRGLWSLCAIISLSYLQYGYSDHYNQINSRL